VTRNNVNPKSNVALLVPKNKDINDKNLMAHMAWAHVENMQGFITRAAQSFLRLWEDPCRAEKTPDSEHHVFSQFLNIRYTV